MDESNIPIDINIGKLQDWLISRRHVNKEWQKSLPAVREKINNALQDMPAHDDIASLLAGSYINYFHCRKIIEILKETEADTKNLFGRYGSQRMKDWQDITKNYEKENLYLAEAAQILVRNINYEIPGLKKQIAKEEQLQMECEKKHLDFLKNESSSKSEFLTLCKQLGIQGDRIKKELVDRLQELPEIYDKLGKNLKPLKLGIELYTAFSKYILGDKAPEVLPLLQYVVENGNTTVYEWSYGEPPLSVEPDPVHIEIDDEDQGAGDQIDFSDTNEIDFGSIDAPAADIDFGDGDAGGEIDWGNIDVASPENIDLSADLAHVSLEESGIVVEEQGVCGGVARGKDALTLMDNPATRNQIIDQLVELESFLKMRLYETNTSGDSHSFSLLQQLPTESTGALTAMLDAVQVAAAKLTAPELNHLHNVKHSPRYVDVLTGQLKQKLSLCDKLSRLAARAADRSAAAATRAAQARPVLARILHTTKELQAQQPIHSSSSYPGCRDIIRTAMLQRCIPTSALEIVLASLSDNTLKQYDVCFKRWYNFCVTNAINIYQPSIPIIIEFLTQLFHEGVQYGTINSHRAALSLIIGDISEDDRINRFCKGVYRLRPPLPRYNITWDVNIVLNYLSTLFPNENLTLEKLSKKCATLLTLVTAHRVQTLSKININEIVYLNDKIIIKIKDIIKTSKIGTNQPTLYLPFFAERPEICPAKTLSAYLAKTLNIRNSNEMFISYRKPFNRVTSQTLSRWIKSCLKDSGIDVTLFSSHSTRHASTSMAYKQGVSLDVIRQTAGWSGNSTTFAKFYHRRIIDRDDNIALAKAVCSL